MMPPRAPLAVVTIATAMLLATLAVSRARAQNSGALVFDTFTAAANTPLMSHAPNLNAAGAPWIVSGAVAPGQWGLSTDIPVPGDYDGDGKVDPAIYRPSTGLWAVLTSSTGYQSSFSVSWGLSTDIPVPGDYDGDGKTDPAVYRAALSGGVWYFLKSSTNFSTSGSVMLGGLNGDDIPVPGDYDGDHKTDPAVFSPSAGVWTFAKSSTNYASSEQHLWGTTNDKPVPGDYDGDGKVDPAIYRPSTGLWAILNSSTNYTTSSYATWGVSTDTPVPADYDGDGKTDPAVQRSSTGVWFVLESSTGYATRETFEMGAAGSGTPTQGDYNGDHKADAAAYRPSNGTWRYLPSTAVVLTGAGEAAVPSVGSSWLSATIDAQTADGTISVDYRVPVIGPPFGGVVARFTDPQNFLFVAHYNGALNLFRVVNGAFATVDARPVTAAPGSVHRIGIRLAGGAMAASWDGVTLFTANESFQQTATRHGIGWNPGYSPSGTYDNFEIDRVQIVRVDITPTPTTLATGNTQTLVARAYDADNLTVPVSFTWSTSNAAVAEVSASGVVTARGPGTATITATPQLPMGGSAPSGTATVVVKAPAWLAPDTFTFGTGTSGDAWLYNPFSGAYSAQVNSGGAFTTLTIGTWDAGWIVRAADLNGDGRTDLLRYNPIGGQVIRTINQGSGGFANYSSTSLAGAVPTLVDFNGDGRTDLFLFNPATGEWAKGLSNGDADFIYSTGVWGPHWQVYAADWDGNVLGDLFLYDPGNGQTCKVTSLLDGSFAYSTTPWSAGWEIYPADFNRDGRTDVFLYNRATGGWTQMLSVPSGWVAGAQGQWSPGWTIRVGDFNHDGRSDLFRYNADTGGWTVLTTKADLSFDSVGGAWSAGWGVSVTDFNGDGTSDLLLSNGGTGQWMQAITTGPGTFSSTSGTWSPGWTVVSRTASVPIATAVVIADVPDVGLGANLTLNAWPRDSSGTSVGGVPLRWTTSNSAVLALGSTIGQPVQATALSVGSAIVTATTSDGLAAQKTVFVHCAGHADPSAANVRAVTPGGTTTLTAPGCTWSTIIDPSGGWLSVSPSAGSGGGPIAYTAQANGTTSPRTGKVTFNGSDGFAFAVFTVNQAAPQHCTGGTFPTGYPNFPDEGAVDTPLDLTVTGVCPWVATSDSPTWLWVNPLDDHGTETKQVRYTVEPNATNALRIGRITFKGAEDGQPFVSFMVAQYGGGNAPALGRHNYRFTVDNDEKYLIFVSYFDALRRVGDTGDAASLEEDFQFLKDSHIDGIRIFPNWLNYSSSPCPKTDDDTVIDSAGIIQDVQSQTWKTAHPESHTPPWERLLVVLNAASAHSLLVDMSFARETVAGLNAANYKKGVQKAASTLKGQFANAMFDVQNEFPLHVANPSDAADLVTAVHDQQNGDPHRIAFASEGGEAAGADAKALGFDVVGYHDDRGTEWPTTEQMALAAVNRIIDLDHGLQGDKKPIYLQEPHPMTSVCGGNDGDPDVDHFKNAVKWYRNAGAAAWTFHTRDSFVLGSDTLKHKMTQAERDMIPELRTSADSVEWRVLDPRPAAFYKDINYTGGTPLETNSDIASLAPEWDDTISSLNTPSGKRVVLYENGGFGGACKVFGADASDLRDLPGPAGDLTWNDAASSLRVTAGPTPSEVTFYFDVQYSGISFSGGCEWSAAHLNATWDAKISSIRIPAGKHVTVWAEPDFGGMPETFDADQIDLRDSGWNDRVKSFKIF
jgi:hypothetical protein